MRFAGIGPVKLLFCKNLQQNGGRGQSSVNIKQIWKRRQLYGHVMELKSNSQILRGNDSQNSKIHNLQIPST